MSKQVRLRLRSCLAPSSKNQVQSSSCCRPGGDFTSNLPTVLWLSLLPATHPRPSCPIKTSRRRPYGSAVPSSSAPSTCKQESGSTQLGVPTRGRFHLKPRHCHLSLSLLPATHPRPRCSTKASRHRPYDRTALRLRPCLTSASKNQVQPSSGCRQGGDFTTNLATAL